MLEMDQYEFMRVAHRVYGKSIGELVQVTGHSRNTVRKALRGEPWGYKERQHQPFPVLGRYLGHIDSWLEQDKGQPKKQWHKSRRVYNRLRSEHDYRGSEYTVRRYVRFARIKLGLDPSNKVYIPSDPKVGREADVDWGTANAILCGESVRLKYFCMRSKYSGKHFGRFYPCERQQAFFDGHIQAFLYFGGIFPVLIYNNLTTALTEGDSNPGQVYLAKGVLRYLRPII
ncbi:transposase [Desulfonatronum parangueonense]